MHGIPVITLDGPAGVGKSTLARKLAELFHIPCLNTGAMFRTLALHLGEDAIHLPEDELRRRCDALVFTLQGNGEKASLCCNGEAVGDAINNEEAGRLASLLAPLPAVRESLKQAQRNIAAKHALVTEGRDMGTVIFPNARFKFFLDADAEIRARRRYDELMAKGEDVSLQSITMQIKERDAKDRNRSTAPLRAAEDAVQIDTGQYTVDELVQQIKTEIEKKGGLFQTDLPYMDET